MLEQWYWLIPNSVLFSKELTDKQKLLFCVISNLCAEKWFCWATNEYLWERLWVNKWTISKNITTLYELWFIDIENWLQRKITLVENHKGGCEKSQGGVVKNHNHNNTIEYYNIIEENKKESFETFRKQYPHARKGKKKDSEQYFLKQNPEEVMKQVWILKRKIKAWLQDAQFIPACERWIRDFTPISEDVIKQDLIKICKRHLNAWGDMKERSQELKQTFWDEQINWIVKAIQQKDSPKNLFIKAN